MKVEEAIQKAIEGGWKPSIPMPSFIEPPTEADMRVSSKEAFSYQQSKFEHIKTTALLDPEFWQALGKSMGWKAEQPKITGWTRECLGCNSYVPKGYLHKCQLGHYEWLYKWHQFIDHLADGKTIESYFENL